VEAFVDEKHGSNYLKTKIIKKDLAQTIKELKMLKIQSRYTGIEKFFAAIQS